MELKEVLVVHVKIFLFFKLNPFNGIERGLTSLSKALALSSSNPFNGIESYISRRTTGARTA